MDVNGQLKNGMKVGFFLITIIACLHYDFGSDYNAYYKGYLEITSLPFDFDMFMSGDIHRNPGWAILNWLFQYLGGFFTLVAVLNIIQNFIYFKFINNNAHGYQKVFAVFLYLFLANYYMMNFSMMRQGFVVAGFLALWPWIKEKRWLLSLGVIFILTLIHNSAVILYPFAFWGGLPLKNSRPFAIVMIVVLIALYLSQDFLSTIFNRMMVFEDIQSFAERYEESKKQMTFGIGALIQFFPIVFSALYLFHNNETDEKKKSLVALSMIGSIATPFNSIIFLIGRISLYFGVFSLVAIPIVFQSIRNRLLKLCVIILYVLITIYNITIYYIQPQWNMDTYHTIFDAL
ncbi:EpsG family protein [Bacteroides sp. GM023]|uniref:EpsG family protein n=1 Tax=Bacteroides sp. GM023 TaxID=2723058 RepID=UPI00168A517A|nr:EpsG family protein [Bacteroides sp. GM023]MBD3589412.1 EpsG family protein [Bacteroides sp. GM023]